MRWQAGRRPWSALYALCAMTVLVVSACFHDWEDWLPPNANGTGTTSGTTTGTGAGTTTNTGTTTGTPSGSVPGTCPEISGTTDLVKVVTLQHTAMCIDATEVTKGQYEAWLNTNPSTATQPAHCLWNDTFTPQDPTWPPEGVGLQLPVSGVNWCDAHAYCTGNDKWLCGEIGTGNTIDHASATDPWMSEWFCACTERGQNNYPYGTDYEDTTCNGTDADNGGAVEVGSMSSCITPAGVYDLSGNVSEWEASCSGNTGESDQCNIRGGGFNGTANEIRCAAATPSARNTRNVTVGFRCCRNADP